MTQKPFDPYRKWLGIPPRDQPPNHYRLLGIEIFESDPDVISNAADGRMGQIRTFQTGRHSEWSQRLLNEVASARVCLLNEAKKAAYDETLRQELGPQNAPPVVSQGGPPPAAASQDGPPPIMRPEIPSQQSGMPKVDASPSDFRRPNRLHLPILMAVVAVAVVVIGLVVMLLQSDGGSAGDIPPDLSPRTQVAVADNAAADGAATQPDEISADGQSPPDDEEGVDGQESEGTMDVTPDPPESEPGAADVQGVEEGMAGDVGSSNEPPPDGQVTSEPAPDTPTPDSPSPEPMPPPVSQVTTEPAPDSPSPKPLARPDFPPPAPNPGNLGDLIKPADRSVPDETAREDVGERIRKIFQEDFDSSDTPAAKVALAAKLRQKGIDADDDRVARFVFLEMAAELAVAADNPQEAFKAIAVIQEHYDADVLEMKVDVLIKVIKEIRGGETGAYLAQAAALLAEEAVARDDYKMAGRLLQFAGQAARKANNKIMSGELEARERKVNSTARAYAPIKKAFAVLADDPQDHQANVEVGRWYCFKKNDWPRGLAYLAKGENTTLAELAERDLAGVVSSSQKKQLGDAWWELSGEERGPGKAAYMCRAAYWYETALIGATVLDRAAIEQRLEAAARDDDVIKSPTWGTVADGNVALAINGTTVEGVEIEANRLLDGNTSVLQNARGKCPAHWVITFSKPYRLQEIRFRLWDMSPRYYRYRIGTSSNGKDLMILADRSQGYWSSWQQLRFAPRLVKSVHIFGLEDSFKKHFSVGEFEAYCIPPKTPPDTSSQ